MNDSLYSLLDSEPSKLVVFGFAVYLLFSVWRKLAARWVNWFPLAAKLTRLVLYACGFGVVLLGLRAFPLTLDPALSVGWFLLGLALPTGINLLARQLKPREKLRRGATVRSVSAVNRQAKRELPAADFRDSIEIAGVNIPRSAETYHFLVVGSTGSGKSVAITRLLDAIEARGDLALVVDSGGEFASRYYKEGRDHIINPYDDRCAPWSPTAELAGPGHAEALAKSMVPDGVGEDAIWSSFAQTFMTAILNRLLAECRLSIKDLLYYAQVAPIEELKVFLAGTPAVAPLDSERTFASIRTYATNCLAAYAYLQDHPSPFSVSKFIQREKPGFLFLTYREDQLDSLRNLIACALDVASRTVLSLKKNEERRVWLIIDEFASIGRVQSIEAFATKARKNGGCLLVSLQSVSQLQKTYGDKGAQTIFSCLSSWLVLRSSDPETAEYISTYIGDAELSRMTKGESSSDSGGGSSLNEQIQTQRAVMPVELQKLKNRVGFFKLAGDYPICRVKLAFPKKREQASEHYAERDFIAKPMLDLVAKTGAPKDGPKVGQAGAGAEAAQREAAAQPVAQEGAAREPAKAAVPAKPAPLKLVKNPFEVGPEALEEVLEELADTYENAA
jgi:hypothetical protein